MIVHTAFDAVLLKAASGYQVGQAEIEDLDPPPGVPVETWRSDVRQHVIDLRSLRQDGMNGAARRAASALSEQYRTAFGDEGPPPVADVNPPDPTGPAELADLIRPRSC